MNLVLAYVGISHHCHTMSYKSRMSRSSQVRFCWDSRANPLVVATEPAEVGFQVEFRNWKFLFEKIRLSILRISQGCILSLISHLVGRPR